MLVFGFFIFPLVQMSTWCGRKWNQGQNTCDYYYQCPDCQLKDAQFELIRKQKEELVKREDEQSRKQEALEKMEEEQRRKQREEETRIQNAKNLEEIKKKEENIIHSLILQLSTAEKLSEEKKGNQPITLQTIPEKVDDIDQAIDRIITLETKEEQITELEKVKNQSLFLMAFYCGLIPEKKNQKLVIPLAISKQKLFACGNYFMKESYEKGVEYYILSALQGYAPAQFKMGIHYQLGLGSESKPDLIKAFYYYKLSADQKFPNALFKLGECYENGVGCEKDLTKANELRLAKSKLKK